MAKRVHALVAGFLFITSGMPASAAIIAPAFGTDTRALHFFPTPRFQYEGGYEDDRNEYDVVPNGETSSVLSRTFTGSTRPEGTYSVPLSAYHFASADLATGKLKAFAEDPALTVHPTSGAAYDTFNQGRSNASLLDTLFLNFDDSLAGQFVKIGFRVGVDGVFTANAPTGSGSASLDLRLNYLTSNGATAQASGGYSEYFGNNNNVSSPCLVSGTCGFDVTFLAAPTTVSLFSLLSVNAYGGVTDFSHTANLSLELPEGVSFTSASGVFLAGASSAVPEPATWAYMIAGLGLTGCMMRRSRRGALSLS